MDNATRACSILQPRQNIVFAFLVDDAIARLRIVLSV